MTAPAGPDIPAGMVAPKAFAAGCSAGTLSDDERAFFRAARPCGLILFARNCESPDQLRRLVDSVIEAAGADPFMVLIDQEGGRVRRLRPPAWRDYPSAAAFGRLYAHDREAGLEAAYLAARLVAAELRAAGINVNCTPVLDVPVPGAHEIIGDRAFSGDPDVVAALGRAVAQGFLDGGVVPVIKHIPGHGRAGADSHEHLPVIAATLGELEASDFRPFATFKDMPAAMTAHVLLTALDPEHPVSVSPVIIGEVIRGTIGFEGLLISDDLSMKALSGSLGERAQAALAAGCDIALHCNGDLREMEQIAEVVPDLSGRSLERFQAALAGPVTPGSFDERRATMLIEQVATLERA